MQTLGTDGAADGGAEGPILVIGGTGKTGRRVVERLRARAVPVRVGSRSAELPFDWEHPESWGPALDGASGAYISFYPDLAAPGAAEAVGTVAELAAASGLQRLVLLSGRGEEEAQRAEALAREAFGSLTVLRCSWFAQNFSEGYLLDPVLEGCAALPVGEIAEPFVDVDDIAEVATVALTEAGHAGELYELTGPRLLSFADPVGEIADATGRPVRFEAVPMQGYKAALLGAEVPEGVTALLEYLFTEVLDGRNAHLADGVARALGRPPRDFREYAQQVAAAGAWNQPATVR